MRDTPSTSIPSAIIVFDGHCVLCSRWVGFLLKHDNKGQFQFAAMQSDTGKRLLVNAGLDPDDPSSFLLVRGDSVLTQTTAIITLLKSLDPPWPLVAKVLGFVPTPIRDWVYFRIARIRYKIFGQRDQCYVPSAEQSARFLK